MPRRKVNIYTVDEGNIYKINTGGVKCSFDEEHDCYYISLKDLKKKMRTLDALVGHTFIEINTNKYYFTNMLIDKNKRGIDISLVYEKHRNSQFTEMTGNLEDFLEDLPIYTIQDNDGSSKVRMCYFYIHNIYNIKFIKNKFYLADKYIERDGIRRSFLGASIINYINTFVVQVEF